MSNVANFLRLLATTKNVPNAVKDGAEHALRELRALEQELLEYRAQRQANRRAAKAVNERSGREGIATTRGGSLHVTAESPDGRWRFLGTLAPDGLATIYCETNGKAIHVRSGGGLKAIQDVVGVLRDWHAESLGKKSVPPDDGVQR